MGLGVNRRNRPACFRPRLNTLRATTTDPTARGACILPVARHGPGMNRVDAGNFFQLRHWWAVAPIRECGSLDRVFRSGELKRPASIGLPRIFQRRVFFSGAPEPS